MYRTTMSPPRNHAEAVTHQLFLALMAPSDVQAAKASAVAEAWAQGLTRRQVEACKAAALRLAAAAGFGGGMGLLN